MKHERQNEILDYIRQQTTCTVSDLAEYFGVSVNTIRRDINDLFDLNLIVKRYGSIELAKKVDTSYTKRASANRQEKEQIARYAARLIKDNDVIFIDAGTTTALVPDYISPELHLSIFTNNFLVVEKAKDVENWQLNLVGTRFRHKSQSFVQARDWEYLDSVNLSRSFIAASGFTLKHGATNTNEEEMTIKHRMMKRCHKSYLLMDSTKFDRVSLYTFAQVDDFSHIITSAGVPESYKAHFADTDVLIEVRGESEDE